MSMTGNPVKEHQITNEQELAEYNLKLCIFPGMVGYINDEEKASYSKDYITCPDPIQTLLKVADSKKLFTLSQQSVYVFNKKHYFDEYGNPTLFYFDKPYGKFIFSMFFFKGFPLTDRMQVNTIRLKDSGLVQKSLHDRLRIQEIQYKFRDKPFEARLVIPWFIYITGCITAVIAFIFEICFIRCKEYFCKISSKI